MCIPLALPAITATQAIVGGISAAATAAGAIGAARQGQANVDAIGAQRQVQAGQIGDAAGQKIGERVKQARAERSRLRVAAGEAGVAGQSFEALLADSAFQENEDIALINKDTANSQDASQARTNAATAQQQTPGLLSSGLQIVGAGISKGASVPS